MNKYLVPGGLSALGVFLIVRANEAFRIDESVRQIQETYGGESTGSLSGNEGFMMFGGIALVVIGVSLLILNQIKKR